MKEKLLFVFIVSAILFLSCNSNELAPPVIDPNPYVNPYSGNYYGLFYEQRNGADSTGVFKDSTAYTYTLDLQDEGNELFGFSKGDLSFDSIAVNDTGGFTGMYIQQVMIQDSLDSIGNPVFKFDTTTVSGYFYAKDSVYMDYKYITGAYEPTEWFAIVQLIFRGRKVH